MTLALPGLSNLLKRNKRRKDSLASPAGADNIKRLLSYGGIEDEQRETYWQQTLLSNPNLDFLRDSEENIYTIHDGMPFYD